MKTALFCVANATRRCFHQKVNLMPAAGGPVSMKITLMPSVAYPILMEEGQSFNAPTAAPTWDMCSQENGSPQKMYVIASILCPSVSFPKIALCQKRFTNSRNHPAGLFISAIVGADCG